MHKLLISALSLSLMLLLSSCQSSSNAYPMFNSVPPDTSLTTCIRNAFTQSNEPMLSNVRIESVNGKVILSGYVKKIRQSDTAEQIAHRVPGVQEVENNIIVRQ